MQEFHVFNGYNWLSDDEKSWIPIFNGAASFTSAELARDIGERARTESMGDFPIYVFQVTTFK